jgi:two-component system chemotaxis response regulator CheY
MPVTVLVIDDSPAVRHQVCAALEGAGFAVVEAGDGVQGLMKLNSAIRLVVCDLNMPRVDGLKVLERVTKSGAEPAVPVLMLTTEADRSLVGRAKALGARGWIVKPFRTEQLIAAVHRVLASADAGRDPDATPRSSVARG